MELRETLLPSLVNIKGRMIAGVDGKKVAMARGEHINSTEDRAGIFKSFFVIKYSVNSIFVHVSM